MFNVLCSLCIFIIQYGRRPLHVAYWEGKGDIVKLLAESGASNLEAVKVVSC